MRVAFLSYDFGEYSVRLAGALAQHAEVLLLLPKTLAEPHLSLLEPKVHFRPFGKPRLRQPVSQLGVLYGLLREIKAFNPDVVHLQQGHLWGNAALPFLRAYPLVLTVHDPRHHAGDRGSYNTPQGVFDYGFRRATTLIVHAERLKRELLERLALPGANVHVVPHIAIGRQGGERRSERGGSVLFYGRIWPYKGLEYLIRAEPLVSAAVPEATFVIAGEGEDFGRYRKLMVHPERFRVFNEYVPEAREGELFEEASVVVLPYTEASQSGVIPVAYSHAKPVVATTVGGLPEMVEHGKTGYLVPPKDERALADAIVKLLKDGALRRELGARGKEKLRAECSPEVVAAQTLKVYRQALRTHVAPGVKRGQKGVGRWL